MATIISDNGNPAYDGNLTTANAFYRVEAANLAPASSTFLGTDSNLIRAVNVTFANAGNCQGVALILASTAGNDHGLEVDLQESLSTCTMTVANPCVVTRNSHGLSDGNIICFTTTGALPTGLSIGKVYYVRNATLNTFNVSTTPSGSLVVTTGTQSGTHTLWASRTSDIQTIDELFGGSKTITGAYDLIVPFDFDTPYAVDTTASKWRFFWFPSGGVSSTHWYVECSDGTTACYATWCDTQISYSSGDTMIVKNKLTIDGNLTLNGITSTGYTTNGIALWICRTDTTPDIDNVCNLLWDSTPAASYTFTLKGYAVSSSRGGFRIGTPTQRIPYAQKAILNWGPGNISTGVGFNGYRFSGTTQFQFTNLFFYGEYPTTQEYVLNGDAASGQKVFTVTDATGLSSGDTVVVGKADVADYGLVDAEQTIDTVVGNNVTLLTNLSSYTRKSGGHVLKTSGYGIVMTATTTKITNDLGVPANFVLDGVRIDRSGGVHQQWNFSPTASQTVVSGSVTYENSANTIPYSISNVFGYPSSTGVVLARLVVPEKGINFNHYNLSNSGIGINLVNSMAGGSGQVSFQNCHWIMTRGGTMTFNSASVSPIFSNNVVENASGYITFQGNNLTHQSNTYWGSGGLLGIVRVGVLTNTNLWSGNTYNKCAYAVNFALALAISDIATNDTFGNLAANTNDIDFGAGGSYFDFEFSSPTGNLTINTTNLNICLPGSKIRISDFNDTTSDDRVWTPYGYFRRTKDGLSDTTVHTLGGSALRFESTSSTNALTWTQTIPTGDIQNKKMTVAVWCKINSANYYSATHQLPRLTINYDNGTTAYAQASTSTDWQLLFVTFTPLTTYGSITATLSTMTDQTESNAYVYFDDFGVLYPAGVTLDLGKMDDWANALPVTPGIAVPISAYTVSSAVWEELLASHPTSGTFGKQMAKLLKTSTYLGTQ